MTCWTCRSVRPVHTGTGVSAAWRVPQPPVQGLGHCGTRCVTDVNGLRKSSLVVAELSVLGHSRVPKAPMRTWGKGRPSSGPAPQP